ncbi:hypothetical protein L1987_34000 [Smallanthus sonchifolius]|uniref:Uncharacterized protein n=1 Tax=Smallanthus sonchifolius TaxID=185202 RepID=A0ACB9HT06_9ASTR|nr:hypothetical protein L1987_34000 [Smallanthus sonchifolius]
MLLFKMKEALKSFELDSSQEATVFSCIALKDCDHKNTIKLIWGTPGTGKTKTISSLLFMLLRMKCRTLTCWKGIIEWIICFLEDPEEQYQVYLKGELIADEGHEMTTDGLCLMNQPTSTSSSRASSYCDRRFGNRRSNGYGDSRSNRSLMNQPTSTLSSSSRASSYWRLGIRRSNKYGDSRSHGKGSM